MDLHELNYILALAEYRNMTRAAESLYISQSALSHHVKNIENSLGTSLFDRSTSPLTLTEVGRCYVESAKRILAEEERLQKEIRDITHHMRGTLKIGVAPDRLSYMLPRLLPRFTQLYPGISVKVTTGSGQVLLDALREGTLDLVFLSDGLDIVQQGLSSELLYTEEIVLAIHPSLLSPEMLDSDCVDTILPQAFQSLPLFMLPPGHGSRAFCEKFFKRHQIHPNVQMEFPSNISCYRMAATGMGAAIIPYMTTRITHADEDIRLLSLGNPPETWNIHIFYRNGTTIGQPEKDLIQLSKDTFADEKLYHS